MPANGANQASPVLSMVIYLLFFGLIFYFMLIRPQRKKDKQFKDMLSTLEIGDEIITIGGLYGKVTKIKDEKISFESGTVEKTTIHIYKWGIKEVKKKEKA